MLTNLGRPCFFGKGLSFLSGAHCLAKMAQRFFNVHLSDVWITNMGNHAGLLTWVLGFELMFSGWKGKDFTHD